MLNVVLVEPEIPPNTGSIGRLCLAAGARLHLVGPLGFSLDDRALKRAGLDYWSEVEVAEWDSLDELRSKAEPTAAQFFFLTTKAKTPHWSAQYRDGDYLIFGSETRGLPESLLKANADRCLTIPQQGTRSLNLATAVGIVLYEAIRQIGDPG